jgi:threonine dehydrogenase-like Zn-dependent dehydrogenase
LCAIWWARIMGAEKIVATSRAPRRAAMALAMGADGFVQSGDDDAAEISEALGGPPDIVLECVGNPGFLAKAIALVRPFGEVVSMGFCTAPDSIVPATTAFKAATLKFPVGYGPIDFTRSVEMLDRGHAHPAMLVTATATLEELPAALASLRQTNAETKVQILL